mmetsp:Transcript_25591/g.57187  ORF Transcript_25591/g.57187 Transcript_25591/m.57187 type:complete len:405 (-) Transcript_25591:50-1264(-)
MEPRPRCSGLVACGRSRASGLGPAPPGIVCLRFEPRLREEPRQSHQLSQRRGPLCRPGRPESRPDRRAVERPALPGGLAGKRPAADGNQQLREVHLLDGKRRRHQKIFRNQGGLQAPDQRHGNGLWGMDEARERYRLGLADAGIPALLFSRRGVCPRNRCGARRRHQQKARGFRRRQHVLGPGRGYPARVLSRRRVALLHADQTEPVRQGRPVRPAAAAAARRGKQLRNGGAFQGTELPVRDEGSHGNEPLRRRTELRDGPERRTEVRPGPPETVRQHGVVSLRTPECPPLRDRLGTPRPGRIPRVRERESERGGLASRRLPLSAVPVVPLHRQHVDERPVQHAKRVGRTARQRPGRFVRLVSKKERVPAATEENHGNGNGNGKSGISAAILLFLGTPQAIHTT